MIVPPAINKLVPISHEWKTTQDVIDDYISNLELIRKTNEAIDAQNTFILKQQDLYQ